MPSAMNFDTVMLRITIAMIKLMSPFVTIFYGIESLVYRLLFQPTATSFRMFPPEEHAWPSRSAELHVYSWYASCACTLLICVPYMLYAGSRQHRARNSASLTAVLWKRSRLVALVVCVMRFWFMFSVWNYVLLKEMDDAVAQGLDRLPKDQLSSRHWVLLVCSFLWMII